MYIRQYTVLLTHTDFYLLASILKSVTFILRKHNYARQLNIPNRMELSPLIYLPPFTGKQYIIKISKLHEALYNFLLHVIKKELHRLAEQMKMDDHHCK